MSRNSSWRIVIMIGTLLLAGCGVFSPPQTPTATLRGAVVPTRIPTETPTSSHTPSRTPTHIPTATPMPTAMVSPTTVPTVTPTHRTVLATSTEILMLTSVATNPSTRQTTPTVLPDIIEIDDINDFTYSDTVDRRDFEFWFGFEGQQGTLIGVQMTSDSGDLDPYLLLLDENADILFENDDDPQGSNRDAYIRDFVLPETGRYFVIATRFRREQGSTTGDFTLSLTHSKASTGVTLTPTVTDGAASIASGDIVEGTIDDASPTAEYVFIVDAAVVVDIELMALTGNLDAYLLVLNADGDVLFENDDDPEGAGRDSYLRAIRLPEAGQYTIVATRFQQAQGSTSGDFRLRFVILD